MPEVSEPIPIAFARLLFKIYATRPCWICKRTEWCGHREPLVDLAEFAHALDGLEVPKEKP